MKPYQRLTLFFFTLSFSVFSQDHKAFKIRNEFEIQGDITIIGNQILSQKSKKTTVFSPYNDVSEQAKINDQLKMYYVDIDENEDTFSSSSANLILPENSQIAYAGLYWSAIYPYTLGEHKSGNKFKILDKERLSPENILLKIPSKDEYIPIQGSILADTYNSKNELLKEKGGYLAYSDVTQIIKSQKQLSGTYFVANVLAANGEVYGGTCGGWVLVVVFENEAHSVKKIITQDGFVYGSTSISYDFSGKENEDIRVLGAALEGDRNIANDKMIAHLPQNNISFPLKTDIRKENDFFNSTITKNNQHIEERAPNSLNTLGFDLYDIDLSKEIIAKDVGFITFKVISVADKTFQFFNAVCVELTETKTTENELTNNNITIEQSLPQNTNQLFYNIVGVFKNKHYAINFVNDLAKEKIIAKYWLDEQNNLYYIYTQQSQSEQEAQRERNILNEQKKIKNWIRIK